MPYRPVILRAYLRHLCSYGELDEQVPWLLEHAVERQEQLWQAGKVDSPTLLLPDLTLFLPVLLLIHPAKMMS